MTTSSISSDLELRMDRAFLIAREVAPFFDPSMLQMRIIYTESITSNGRPTAGVDAHWNCYIHPQIDMNHEQLAFTLLHECSHLIQDHCGRGVEVYRTGVSHECWNICADLDVNSVAWMYAGKPLQMPSDIVDGVEKVWVIQPQTFRTQAYPQGVRPGLAAESYLKMIPDNHRHSDGIGGSCADGVERPWETEGSAVASPEAIRDSVAQRIVDYAKQRGNQVGGALLDWARAQLSQVVDPYALFHNYLTVSTNCSIQRRSSWRRTRMRNGMISPRYANQGVNVGVVVDTSGSMLWARDKLTALEAALANVTAIMRAVGSVQVFWCDTAVKHQAVYSPADLKPKGGGGTDLRPAIRAAEASGVDVVVVITDCDTPWPEQAPATPMVVVAVFTDSSSPDYAQRVDITQ